MSSKRRIRRKACEGKVKHLTMDNAIVALKRSRNNGIQMHTYRCQFCGFFHVGHPNGKVKRAIQMRRSAGV